MFRAHGARWLDIGCDAGGAPSRLDLNFFPHPGQALAQWCRIIIAGGDPVATYVWDYAGKMELIRYFREAAVFLDSSASRPDEGIRFPLCNPEQLSVLCASAGLYGVKGRTKGYTAGHIRKNLAIMKDRSFRLMATAWAGRGSAT